MAKGDRLQPSSPAAPDLDGVAATAELQVKAAVQRVREARGVDRGHSGLQQRSGEPLRIAQRSIAETCDGSVRVRAGGSRTKLIASSLSAVVEVGRVGGAVEAAAHGDRP